MAASLKAAKKRANRQTVIWAAVAALLLLGCLTLGVGLLFLGKSPEDAFKASKRVEFDLDYDKQSNAIPKNLQGEPLDMETAKAMAELAATQAQSEAEEGLAPLDAEELTQGESSAEKPTEESGFESAELPPAHTPDTQTPDTYTEPPPEKAPDTVSGEATPSASAPVATPVKTPDAEQQTTQPAPQPTDDTLILAPVEERSAKGILPKISAEGTKPWQYFAKQNYVKNTNKPRIAIVISGLGLATTSSQDAIALPGQVTLSFSPYGRAATAALSESARAAGHEVMLDLPMQTERYPAVDPGPYGVRSELTAAQNVDNLTTILTKARGYTGLLGTIRDTVSNNADIIVPLIQSMESRGLLYVAGHSQPPAGMFRIQRQASVPVLLTDIILDDRITETHIRNQLARAEDRARANGKALVVGHSYPITVDLLAEWLPTLESKGIIVVPVSAMGEP